MARANKATEAPIDPLDAMLMRLQLFGIRDQLDSLLDEAGRANLSMRETLMLLCEREIARKDHRRIEMALKLAHFPAVKELRASTSRHSRRSIPSRSATWPRPAGSPTGRTCCCLACRVSARRTWRSRSGERRSWPDIQRSSRRRRRWSLASPRRTASGAWTRNCWRCRNQKLLIVDELGYLPLEPDAAHLFFQLVSRRYETGAMLITSNRSVAEWGTVFADPVVATAILDRLLHHSHVLTIRGDSYRLRAKRNSGLIRPPVGDRPPVGSASQCLRLVGHNCKQHAYQADRDGARPEDHARLPYTPRNPHRLRAPQHAIFSRNAGHVRPRQQALP